MILLYLYNSTLIDFLNQVLPGVNQRYPIQHCLIKITGKENYILHESY